MHCSTNNNFAECTFRAEIFSHFLHTTIEQKKTHQTKLVKQQRILPVSCVVASGAYLDAGDGAAHGGA